MNIKQITQRIEVLQKEIDTTPICNFIALNGKREEITGLRGLLITLNRVDQLADLDRTKNDRIAVLEEELRKMTEWKDSAYKTIQEIADGLYGKAWSGGKFQVEIIGRAESMRKELESWQKHSMEVARSNFDSKLLDHLELHKYSLDCIAKGKDGHYWTPDFHRQHWHEFATVREALTWAMENDKDET